MHRRDLLNINRRAFLKAAGGAVLTPALASALAVLGEHGAGATATSGARRKKKPVRSVKLGFIALTDCASVVMAKELGLFEKRDLDVTLEKQASWPATRDALLTGQIDGAHALFSLPLSVATGIGGTAGDTSLKIAMVLNANGQAITLANSFAAVGYGDLKKARKALEARAPTLAMTFPGGTHDTWLRYWLKATRAKPSAVNIIPIPPPQMVANMKVGTMDGYCVGEPWNAVAVAQDVGFTHLATQDLWQDHPEKALVVNERFATDEKGTLKDVIAAVLEAGEWLDQLKNRAKAATVLGGPAYVNAPPAEIKGRLEGVYDLGRDLGTKRFKLPDSMVFFQDGTINPPRRAHALWFLAQYQRFGLLNSAPDYQKIVSSILLRDLYEEVAATEGIAVPDDDMAPFMVKLDNTTFDPAKPQQEAKRT